MVASHGQRMGARRGRFDDAAYYRKTRTKVEALAVAQRVRNSKEWKVVRGCYRDEHPLCEACEARGELVPMAEVDHRLPLEVRPDLGLTWSNLQALCHPCHAQKSADERAAARGGKPNRPPPSPSHPKARRPPLG